MVQKRAPAIVCLLLIVWPVVANPDQSEAAEKFAGSQWGMVATGSVYATQAGVRILESGGNAIDAAAAACFALMVTDPANTSLGGRAQILLYLRGGRVAAIDGATQTPAGAISLRDDKESRQGYSLVPVPGAPAALALMVGKHGRLKFADIIQPAIELAENGFKVPPRLALTWERMRSELMRNPGAKLNFLKPDGSAYQAGELFRQPRLAETLRQIANSGIAIFYHGTLADAMAKDVSAGGGFITKTDLQNYRAIPGKLVRTNYRGYQVVSAGGRAWGNTLSEMLNILAHFPVRRNKSSVEEVEVLARVIAQSLEDRPQQLGTLKPKPEGYPLSLVSSPGFAAKRARMIREQMRTEARTLKDEGRPERTPNDTTHLSVMDVEGNTVALTTSIGPSFGARVATPELGFLYAHSYRMRSDPSPQSRDLTEMTPTIVFRLGRPVLSIGAAGSERIPSAILQVISNIVDRGWTLERAITAPRIAAVGQRVRLQIGFPEEVVEALIKRGFEVEMIAPDATRHAGLVHAVQFDRASGMFFGAADPGDSGRAGGVARARP